jgi:hypothetical protein
MREISGAAGGGKKWAPIDSEIPNHKHQITNKDQEDK